MRVLALLVLVLGLMGAAPANAPARPVTHGATFWLGFTDGTCSGTAIGRNLILTAEHCLEGGPLVKVSNIPCAAVGEPLLDGGDHAIIRVNCQFKRWATLGGKLYQGQEIRFYGNPVGLSDLLRRGYVMGFEDGWALIDVMGFKGDSGSGIFDKRGRLVGVISTLYVNGPFHFLGAKSLAYTPEQLSSVGL